MEDRGMALMRLTGCTKPIIYDTLSWTEEEARQDYLDSTGIEADQAVQYLSFDAIEAEELVEFAKYGLK